MPSGRVSIYRGIFTLLLGLFILADGLQRSLRVQREQSDTPSLSTFLGFPDYFFFNFDPVAAELLVGGVFALLGVGLLLRRLTRR